jgi:hypothetical protein
MKLAAAVFLVAISPALAEHPTNLAPEAPEDGAVTGRKPQFILRAAGGATESARFRIELSRDGFRTIAYAFDQSADPNGWVYAADVNAGVPGAIYAPRLPIDAGRYVWRVSSWDGVTWRVGPTSFRLDVDDVPPADVRRLAMDRDLARGCVRLVWDPVVTDARGGTERIARYHVLRFTSAASPASAGDEVGEAKAAWFEDCDPALDDKPLLYYRIVPEDEAGNVPGAPSSVRR